MCLREFRLREFSITAYKQLSRAVRVPLLVAETADGARMNTAINNTTTYESLVRTNPVQREPAVDAQELVHAPTLPEIGFGGEWEILPRQAARGIDDQ